MKKILIICIGFQLTVSAVAQEFRIITPYIGSIRNQLTVPDMDEKLDDSALMEGLFLQWINFQKYQWNAFLYHSGHINDSRLLGGHFIYDRYFKVRPKGKFVIGAGIEMLQIKTDNLSIAGIENFEMTNNIYAPYIRAGRYLTFTKDPHKLSFLLWTGYEQDILRGEISFRIPPMPPFVPEILVDEKLDTDYHYLLAGFMIQATLFHFFDMKFKYHGKIDLDRDEYLDVYSAMVNLFLCRKIGLSYRFKFMEEVIGDNTYHLGGISFVF